MQNLPDVQVSHFPSPLNNGFPYFVFFLFVYFFPFLISVKLPGFMLTACLFTSVVCEELTGRCTLKLSLITSDLI